jgi:methylated-DNA-[protein]-cysteine S-methyltransferase
MPPDEEMRIPNPCYDAVSTPFGPIAIVWWNGAAGPRVRQILLCGEKAAEPSVLQAFPGARLQSAAEIAGLGDRIRQFLNGRELAFDLERMALEACGGFQRRILEAEHAIPRGWISTYGRLAGQAGAEGGGRAAGRALATNPFPIVIPCHRTVRSDGNLGGYQGGKGMKRALLEMEGVEFDGTGRVVMNRVWYSDTR